MNAFITGSHAYGTPTEDSDIDLAVCMEPEELAKFRSLLPAGSPRFGKLNLILLEDDDFDEWFSVTEHLKKFAPVTRDEAIAAFQACGFDGSDYDVPVPDLRAEYLDMGPDFGFRSGF